MTFNVVLLANYWQILEAKDFVKLKNLKVCQHQRALLWTPGE